jgi:DNA-binding winged helix-turn-helix (wHTH) protein
MFYEFDRFRLDVGKRLLLRDGDVVPLSAKAFDILAVLVQEHGRPVNKDELMRRVWVDAIVEENNLTVHMSALRKALGEHPGDHRFIVTLPGRGYQCVTEMREVGDQPVPTIDNFRSRSKYVATATLLLIVAGSVLLAIYTRPETDTRAQRPSAGRLVNPEAHALYIKGRFFWSKRSQDGIEKAIDYFRQAVQKDPEYALAYSGWPTATSCSRLDRFGREAMSQARKAASRGLELDDTLAAAHSSIANITRLDDFDWGGAEREFKRALELDSAYAPAHQGYAILLSALGATPKPLPRSGKPASSNRHRRW